MKKVLSTVAALALVAGVASNAMALDKPLPRASEVAPDTAPRVATPTAPGVALWSVAGQWALAGFLVNGGTGNGTPGSSAAAGGADVKDLYDTTDAWYIYSFKILPVLQVNDKISMKGEVRFVDRCIFGATCGKAADDRDADFKHVYMEWVSPYGKTRFGRTPAGAWGPKFMNNSAQGDRIMFWPNFMPDNWGALLFTQKITERDAQIPGSGDGDVDGYYLDINYKADFGKTIAALWVARIADDSATDNSVTTTQFRLTGNYTFGDFGIEYEWNQNFGDGTPEAASGKSSKSNNKGTGLMIDVGYQMNDWTFGSIFFYMSGDDDPTDNDRDSLMGSTGVGIDYNPYQILTGDYMALLNGDKGGASPALFRDGVAGVISIGGYVTWKMSPKLTFKGTLGYAEADESPYDYDDDYGIEAGISTEFKIMDNLSYVANFSYLFTGDYWKEDGNPVFESDNEDVYLLAHALSMKF